MLSNSWKVVAFLGLPGVAGGGLLPALIRLEEKDKAVEKGQDKGERIRLKKLREKASGVWEKEKTEEQNGQDMREKGRETSK